jgi:hypothetical protein
MQTDHYQKIQNLVKTAGILSAAEKNEWVDLMDLMNDRQLLELEKILASSSSFAKASADKQQSAISSQQNAFNQKIRRPELTGKDLTELRAPLSVPKPPVPKPSLPKNLPIAQEAGPGLSFTPPQFSAVAKGLGGKAETQNKTGQDENTTKTGAGFKHILNFPKTVGFEAGKDLLSKTFPPKVESQQIKTPKKESAFLTKLKAIFAEKELPPGILPKTSPAKPPIPLAPLKKVEAGPALKKFTPEKPPEKKPERDNITINLNFQSPGDLANVPGLEKVGQELKDILGRADRGGNVSSPAPKVSVPAVLPQIPKTPPVILEIKPEGSSPMSGQIREGSPEANFAKTRTSNLTIQAEKVSISPLLSKAREDNLASLAALSDKDIQALGKKQAQAKKYGEDENVAPGLNFFEASPTEPLAGKPLAAYEKPFPAFVKKSAKIILFEKPGDDMRLETLKDASELSVADLKQHAVGTFFRKLQRLSVQSGWHEAVFNLEKSPLYKAYVNTGAQLLKNQANFEKIPVQGGSAEQLDRKDFEQFTDLLIVMGSKA